MECQGLVLRQTVDPCFGHHEASFTLGNVSGAQRLRNERSSIIDRLRRDGVDPRKHLRRYGGAIQASRRTRPYLSGSDCFWRRVGGASAFDSNGDPRTTLGCRSGGQLLLILRQLHFSGRRRQVDIRPGSSRVAWEHESHAAHACGRHQTARCKGIERGLASGKA